MFKDFDKRLERDIKKVCKARLSSSAMPGSGLAPNPMNVKVKSHSTQRYAVWYGGSILGFLPQFHSEAHSKKEYEEYGPSICRHNPVFSALI